jgi:hypothetical protein
MPNVIIFFVTHDFAIKGKEKTTYTAVHTPVVWFAVVDTLPQYEGSVLESTLSPTTIVSSRGLLIISTVEVNLIVFAKSHFNLIEDARIFVTMNALLRFINNFFCLFLLSTNLLLVLIMFCLCNLRMLVAAVTVVLSRLLIFCTILFFSLLLLPILPLLFSALVIDCCQVAGWLRHPNVCFCFAITGKKKTEVRLLSLIPLQGIVTHTRIMHAVPTVGRTFMKDPVRPIARALDSLTPVPVEVVLDFRTTFLPW